MSEKTKNSTRSSPLLDLQRLLFLTDGVFAITLTLLVLDLKLPSGSSENLSQALLELLPRFGVYLFAFITIANQWTFHHRYFRLARFTDNRLVLLTFCYLLFITLIPVNAAIVGGWFSNPLAVACFSADLVFLCLCAWAVWSYLARSPRLLSAEADLDVFRKSARVWLYIALGFAVAIGAGFLSVYLAYAIWLFWPITAVWVPFYKISW